MTLLEKVALIGFVFFTGSFFELVLEERIAGAENTVTILFSLFFMLASGIAFCAGG